MADLENSNGYNQERQLFLMNDSWNRMTIATDEISRFSNSTSPTTTFFESEDSKIAQFAMTASWIVNWLLLFAKIVCLVLSNSLVVAASLADSAVDLLSQAILSLAERYMGKHNPDYPVGRSRLEALSVLAAASIMSMASIEVIQYSAVDISNGIQGDKPQVEASVAVITILSLCIFLKVVLYIYCKWAQKILESDILEALAEDHINDVFSNLAAIITVLIAANISYLWWFDPAGAILISLVIIYRWMGIIWEQVKKIVGHTAPREFIAQVEDIAREHDPRLSVDCVRAYHSGARYNVEMEVVLPGTMTVIESHDVALALQHKIEMLSDVERAFVHVDHQGRDGLEHKVERQLVRKFSLPVTGSTSPGRDNGENGGRNSIAMSPLSSTIAIGISATSATTINGLNRFPRAAYDENNNSSFLHNNIHSAPSSHHHINTTQSDARSRNSYVSAPVRDLDTDYDPENCENYKTESLHKNSSSNNDKYFKSID